MKKQLQRPVSVVFIFCEGDHDVIFIRRVLRRMRGFGKVQLEDGGRRREWTIKEYPAPLNSFFAQHFKNREKGDFSRDMIYKFFLPEYTLVNPPEGIKTVVMLFKAAGRQAAAKVKDFLSSYLPLYQNREIPGELEDETLYRIEEQKFLFVYDCDEQSPEAIHQRLYAELEGFSPGIDEEINFLAEPLQPAEFRGGAVSPCGKIACFAFAGESGTGGTLEEWLFPLFAEDKPDEIRNASLYVDSLGNWPASVSRQAARKKAIICCAGQKKKPGLSYTVVLKEAELLKDETFEGSQSIINFSQFLNSFLSAGE